MFDPNEQGDVYTASLYGLTAVIEFVPRKNAWNIDICDENETLYQSEALELIDAAEEAADVIDQLSGH